MLKRLLFAVLIAALATPAYPVTGTIMPIGKHQFFTSAGVICSSCRIFTYEAGTSTKLTTYTDSALSSSNSNPTTLDSAGRGTFFLSPTSYKIVLAAAGSDDPPSSPIWTVDNVSAVPAGTVDVDITGTAGEALTAGQLVYMSAGDGSKTVGRWYLADADLDYASTTASAMGYALAAISSGASGSIRVAGRVTGLSALSVGSTYYVSATAGAVTSSAPTLARKVGMADSTTSLVVTQWLSIPEASASVAGIINTSTQTLAGVKSLNDHPQFEPGTSSGSYATVLGRLTSNVSAVGNVGSGEDDLMTYSVPANVLDTNGKALRVVALGSIAATADTKTLKFKYGSTQVFTSTAILNDSTAYNWHAEFYIIRTGATAQIAWGRVIYFTGGTIVGAGSVRGDALTTPAETLANAITLKFTGEATSNNDIVQRVMWVEAVG